ncbi:MAG: LTA synthase family protein, partial [Bacteroidota bacterium]
ERSPTPFLDSLIQESWVFENAYAAGGRSTQGIAAIAASVPALMEMPMTFSPYQGNRVQGLAYHLGKKGYTSGFFHGSNPGSMEFERFSKSIGYEKFYDKTAYPNPEDYDGNWGIWDRPFFQFTLGEVNQYNKPFTVLLFSLTSHHPYSVESFFEKKYPEEKPILRAIRYTDYALQQFFATAKKMDWYENTLFVITADHVGRATQKKYKTKVGAHQIPLLFFKPNATLKGNYHGLVQQTDILPTILDYLNFDEPYVAFGQSAFDTTTDRYGYLYGGGFYQILNDSIWLSFDQKNIVGVRNYKNDVLLKHDIAGKYQDLQATLTQQLQAAIQVHHRAMARNKMAVD